MKAPIFEQVPLTIEEDINQRATTWMDGKCVKLDEGPYLTYYAGHHVETVTQMRPSAEGETEEEVQVCMAAPVRIPRDGTTADLRRAAKSDEIYREVLPLYVADHLESYRAELIKVITIYDKSKQVNEFYYQGQSMWLDRDERMIIRDRYIREKADGKERTHLIWKGMVFDVTPDEGISLVNAVASYADQCFDVTQLHLYEVSQLTTPEELISYDFTTGYPPKLSL